MNLTFELEYRVVEFWIMSFKKKLLKTKYEMFKISDGKDIDLHFIVEGIEKTVNCCRHDDVFEYNEL